MEAETRPSLSARPGSDNATDRPGSPTVPRSVRRPTPDMMVAAATAAATITALLLSNDPNDHDTDIWALLLLAAAIVPMAARQRWPMATFAASTAAALTFLGLNYPSVPATVVLLVALYAVAADGHTRLSIAVSVILAGGGLMWRVLVEGHDFVTVLLNAALFVLASRLGGSVHARRSTRATADPGPDPAAHDLIRQVLDRRSFHAVFQPIYALDDGRLVAVEALTRFDAEPAQPPNVWFEQAADVGLGHDLELAAIEVALAATGNLAPDIAVSLNASPDTLIDPRLVALLDRHRPRPLIIEVTEHAVVHDYARLAIVREGLRRRGVKLAVDDAGAGFSSLQHIVQLDPDVIKLDHSLTQNVDLDPVRWALADSLIQFARRTGTQLVAEGIEEFVDLRAWQQLGATAAQGYLLARPGLLPPPARFDLTPQAHEA